MDQQHHANDLGSSKSDSTLVWKEVPPFPITAAKVPLFLEHELKHEWVCAML